MISVANQIERRRKAWREGGHGAVQLTAQPYEPQVGWMSFFCLFEERCTTSASTAGNISAPHRMIHQELIYTHTPIALRAVFLDGVCVYVCLSGSVCADGVKRSGCHLRTDTQQENLTCFRSEWGRKNSVTTFSSCLLCCYACALPRRLFGRRCLWLLVLWV